ncbi:MAG: hypothetical protein ABJC98_03405 [Bacteroidota bacterium]
MKLSTKILAAVLLLLMAGLFASNLVLKSAFEKADKSNLYWNYTSVLETPFHHIYINGGNMTQIAFEPGSHYSVRILENWAGYKDGRMKAFVRHDTLFLDLPSVAKDIHEKEWVKWVSLVRIFSPAVQSVDGLNTNFTMSKMKQKSLTVTMGGKSSFDYESLITAFDSVRIRQSDSTNVGFHTSPDAKLTDAFTIKSLDAIIGGESFLYVGHATVDSLRLQMSNLSGIFLSGNTLKKNHFNTIEK